MFSHSQPDTSGPRRSQRTGVQSRYKSLISPATLISPSSLSFTPAKSDSNSIQQQSVSSSVSHDRSPSPSVIITPSSIGSHDKLFAKINRLEKVINDNKRHYEQRLNLLEIENKDLKILIEQIIFRQQEIEDKQSQQQQQQQQQVPQQNLNKWITPPSSKKKKGKSVNSPTTSVSILPSQPSPSFVHQNPFNNLPSDTTGDDIHFVRDKTAVSVIIDSKPKTKSKSNVSHDAVKSNSVSNIRSNSTNISSSTITNVTSISKSISSHISTNLCPTNTDYDYSHHPQSIYGTQADNRFPLKALVVGDSHIKRLSKNFIKHKVGSDKILFKNFDGANSKHLRHHVIPFLHENCPESIVIHAGTMEI